MTIKEAWDYIQTGGTTALFFVLAYGGAKGFWSFGRELVHLQQELEECKQRGREDLAEQKAQTQRWQDECLHLLKVASQSVEVVERQAKGRGQADVS